jgi:uncharacterized YigZ family protein
MADTDEYKTIRKSSEGLYREKGSRFVSVALPVQNENEIKSHVESIRKEHHEARHHCFAWVLGPEGNSWRANDDGEPSGTAGRPILGQIRSYGLTNILIVVSRYFGGRLLGVSGLINAYRTAADSAIGNAEIIDHVICDYYEISFPYQAMNDVMKIIKEEDINQSEHFFDLECRMTVSFRSSSGEKILGRLSRINGLVYRFINSG